MEKYKFNITEDGSTGLYNVEINDIYHSKTGAYKEAIQKFIEPANIKNIAENNNEIKILDICYGLGYNSKAIIKTLDRKKFRIDAIDTDRILFILSPFIKDNIEDDEIKLFIISELIRNGIDIYQISKILNEYYSCYKEFFTPRITTFMAREINSAYKVKGSGIDNQFLHNIYYNYISSSSINELKANNYKDSILNIHLNDARIILKDIHQKYNIVFLDAFSPQKDPTLWSEDFLRLIKSLMNSNSIFLSYSKSTPFRSALLNLGFKIKKTFIDNIDMGTSASLNENFISNLSDFDYELYNSKSGITYKDPDLNLSYIDILNNRIKEQNSSDRISHTKLLRKYY